MGARRINVLVVGALLALGVAAGIAVSGPINPPAGPIGSTRSVNEPRIPISASTTPGDAEATYVIAEPGSYYLLDNLVGEPAKHGIRVDAVNVTIDLNGFELRGDPGSLDGVTVAFTDDLQDTTSRLAVRNGAIRGFLTGVFVREIRGAVLEDLHVFDNRSNGVFTGPLATILRVSAIENEGGGIVAGEFSRVRDSAAHGSTLGGIFAGAGSVVSGCLTADNGGEGIVIATSGSLQRDAAVVVDSVAVQNGIADPRSGVITPTSAALANVVAVGNGLDGMRGGAGNVLHNIIANQNGADGLNVFVGASIDNAVASDNASDGIHGAGQHHVIRGAVTRGNVSDGIRCDLAGLVAHSFARDNGVTSLRLGEYSVVDSSGATNAINSAVLADNCLARGSVLGQSSGSALVAGNDVLIDGVNIVALGGGAALDMGDQPHVTGTHAERGLVTLGDGALVHSCSFLSGSLSCGDDASILDNLVRGGCVTLRAGRASLIARNQVTDVIPPSVGCDLIPPGGFLTTGIIVTGESRVEGNNIVDSIGAIGGTATDTAVRNSASVGTVLGPFLDAEAVTSPVGASAWANIEN